MSHPLETFADRHPAGTRAALSVAHLAALTVPALTIWAVVTGHTGLAVGGVFAGIGLYATGHAAMGFRYRQRLARAVAEARKDPLTGLPNRALADEVLDAATRAGTPMTVALIDVTGLHTINGNLGHAAGDQYLTTVARRLTDAVPAHGVLVRQGGDEFTLLAPDTGPQDLADRIGAALAGPAVIAGYRMRPRASVGIATTKRETTRTAVLAGWSTRISPRPCRLRPVHRQTRGRQPDPDLRPGPRPRAISRRYPPTAAPPRHQPPRSLPGQRRHRMAALTRRRPDPGAARTARTAHGSAVAGLDAGPVGAGRRRSHSRRRPAYLTGEQRPGPDQHRTDPCRLRRDR